MKILHVLADFQIASGAGAASACGMAEAVAARDHEVSIVCLKHGGADLQPEGVLVRAFAPDRDSGLMPSRALHIYLQQNIQYFDIVHIHGVGHYPGRYAATAARQAKIPYILTPHGQLQTTSPATRGRLRKAVNWFLHDSSVVHHAAAIHYLTISEAKTSSTSANRKHIVIGNGIPSAMCENLPARGAWRTEIQAALGKPDCPLALFFGRIAPHQGLERLLPHWSALLKEHPDLLLVMAGSGEKPHIDTLNTLIAEHHLQGHIIWTGELTGLAKWRTLVDADVFILPAHQTDSSSTIIEAMAAGLPVVLTRECQLDEVKEHQAGVIIEHGDMAAFVRTVSELLSNQEIRKSMRQNAQNLVQSHFTREVSAEKLERLYESLVLHADIPQDLLPPRSIP
ncbi:MAG: glycosyltransferase [Phycisphaerae bacterium]